MTDQYFNFEFNVHNGLRGYKEDPFNNVNVDPWFNWQHNEIDTDDTYEYEHYHMKKKDLMQKLVTPLCQYEYMKSKKQNEFPVFTNKSQDDSIFTYYRNKLMKQNELRKRSKSIATFNQDQIEMYRNLLMSQLKQKRSYLDLLNKNNKRKSLKHEALTDLDKNMDEVIMQLEKLFDHKFLESIKPEIDKLRKEEIQFQHILEEMQNQLLQVRLNKFKTKESPSTKKEQFDDDQQ